MLLTVFEMLKTDFLRLAKFNSLPIVTFVGNPDLWSTHWKTLSLCLPFELREEKIL